MSLSRTACRRNWSAGFEPSTWNGDFDVDHPLRHGTAACWARPRPTPRRFGSAEHKCTHRSTASWPTGRPPAFAAFASKATKGAICSTTARRSLGNIYGGSAHTLYGGRGQPHRRRQRRRTVYGGSGNDTILGGAATTASKPRAATTASTAATETTPSAAAPARIPCPAARQRHRQRRRRQRYPQRKHRRRPAQRRRRKRHAQRKRPQRPTVRLRRRRHAQRRRRRRPSPRRTGADTLRGGDGRDGLFGGADGTADTLRGDGGADRFLPRPRHALRSRQRRRADQVRRRLRLVDQRGGRPGRPGLPRITGPAGTKRILEDTECEGPLVFVKDDRDPDWSGLNETWWSPSHSAWKRRIHMGEWDESDDDANRWARATAIHEIGHNWDAYDEGDHLPHGDGYWHDFVDAHIDSTPEPQRRLGASLRRRKSPRGLVHLLGGDHGISHERVPGHALRPC